MPSNSNDGTEISLRNIVTLLSGGVGEIVSSSNDSTEESLRKVVTLLGNGVGGTGNTAPLAGVQWTTRHTNSTGNPYVIGSIVYHNGRVYRCTATNDSIEPGGSGNPYWADLGVGYLLPNENPKILGGSIDISAGAVTERSYQVETGDVENPFETENETTRAGGSNGNIILKGGNGGFHLLGGDVGGNAGSINTSGGIGSDGRGGNGGSILLVGGVDTADAGSINLSGGASVGNGGSIISTGNGDYNGGTLDLSAGSDGNGGSISIGNKGGSLNLSGNEGYSGGSINLLGDEDGNGGTINGSNNGGSIQFSGTTGRTGGSINLNAGNKEGSSINQGLGGAGGMLQLQGASGGQEDNFANGGNGGTILGNGGLPRLVEEDNGTFLAGGFNAGTINFSAGSAGWGGSIDISNGGGSINTRGFGSIQLGEGATRITLVGAARDITNVAELGNKTITLPNKSGTIALQNSFTIAVPNVDIGKTVASNPLGWSQQVTIPTNIAELTGGLPCILDSVAIQITNRLGTGQLYTSLTYVGGVRVGSQSILALTPVNGVGSYGADDYFTTTTTNTRPWVGGYTKAFTSGGTFGRSLYNGGAIFLNNAVSSGTFRTAYWETPLTEAMGATQTTLLQNNYISGAPAFEGSYLKIDDEVVLITSWPTASGARPTILRAQLGTTATTHAVGANITANLGSALGGGILATVYLNFIRVG